MDYVDRESSIVVSCDNIHKTYMLGAEGVPALRGVALNVYQGEFLVIYGTSGGGKSSLLNVIGTIDVPTKGNLSLFGNRVSGSTPDSQLARLRTYKTGFVFQSFNLLSTMTALDNVSLPMIIAGDLPLEHVKERATKLLCDVGLGHRLDHFPSMLSGGEQQRVAIARSLANNPQMLLLDEPTGDLDTCNTNLILNILLSLNRECGLTMVMVTHDVYMKQYAHRVLYMRDGKVHNIERIDEGVRNHACNELRNSLLQVNEFDASEMVRTEIRAPTDYATFLAQDDLVLKDDSDMQQVVNDLFPIRGEVAE